MATSTATPERPVAAAPVPRPRHAAIAEPWKRSWFYCAPGERATLFWIILIHVSMVVGLVVLPLPSWQLFLASYVMTMLGGLGTTVAYHRALTHGAVKLHWIVEQPLIFFAMLNGSGTPLTWVANHRLHHATSDTIEDISSPKQGGFWWAHLRWLWQAGQAPVKKYCGPLDRPRYSWWGKIQIPMLAFSFFGGLLLGWTAWLWLGPIRIVMALHLQCTVNSICHLGDPSALGGSSKNVGWLAPFHFLQGENWHRNHHESPSDARIGWTPAQVDVGWWTIVTLRALGLARDVQRPRQPSSR